MRTDPPEPTLIANASVIDLRRRQHLPIEAVCLRDETEQLQFGERRGKFARGEARAANQLVGGRRRIGDDGARSYLSRAAT